MNELAYIGKMISLFFALLIYACVWGWTLEHKTNCNKNAMWKVILARLFIGFHIVVLLAWFVWSWII